MSEIITGRCNDCIFARQCGDWNMIACDNPKMPRGHKKKAIYGAMRIKNILPLDTIKCNEYEPSGKQVHGFRKSPF